ncbi:hypothetical protein AVEN_88837-1 [Araneus ventricosus]|uniref:ATP-dependent DNA helicase n=1 Tax=Araneus ventricosus TaxID=182803 RepID=A0A4Y2HS57_ARAVE|nr:hypothetical protein AVEN_88837-1 [Araneus ventricosus]
MSKLGFDFTRGICHTVLSSITVFIRPNYYNMLTFKFLKPLSKYKEDLFCKYILHQKQRENLDIDSNYAPHIYNETFILLGDKCLSICGKTLLQLGLPVPTKQAQHTLDRDLLRETNYNINILQHMVETNKPRLKEDQRTAYEEVMNLIAEGNGGILFLDASGGTGKNFLINLILAEIRSKRHIALTVSSSGIASTLLDGGRTAHSALQLQLNLAQTENHIRNISKRSGKAAVVRTCKLVVWDECTMPNKNSFDALNRTMRDLRNANRITGGVVILLPGDFRQPLPVISRATPADELNASELWQYVQRKT